ncbi:TPA: tRNA pseudouridine(55) synthase TruB, partial [Staphylococcus aureus]|nr:tRNA pseudouridine(55) synthase TruB [Staphylococcus aureus]
RIDLSDELYQKVKNGMRLHKKELGIKAMPESLVALFYQNQVVSLYMPHPTHDKLLKPSKVLRNN